jgi:predicted ATPase
MIYLRALHLDSDDLPDRYPFSVPVIRSLEQVTFDSPVTLFVGENGSGKSTLLEAIAAAVRSIAVGGAEIADDPDLAAARDLAAHLRPVWSRRAHRGFFLRAEDVFNFGKRVAGLTADLGDLAADYEQRFEGYGRDLALGAVLGQQGALVERYGEDPNARSHGESFLHIFGRRFVPNGLYLLDEPDTPLSPQRQLALLALLRDMVTEESQFIIATHSPILMAFPEAGILSFDGEAIRKLSYDEVESVRLMRSFLDDPRVFLRHL